MRALMNNRLGPVLAALLAALTVTAASPALSDERARAPWRENRRLAAEVALAGTPKPYFIFDLERRNIALKTRGMTLLEIPVLEQGIWGPRPAIGPTRVKHRDALARPEVRPGEEKTAATLEQQILELDDMPTLYRMQLAGGMEILVLSRADGGLGNWRNRAGVWRWWLTRPLVTLRQRRQRQEAATVYVVLKPQDAQRLYWSLFEGLDGILVPPP